MISKRISPWMLAAAALMASGTLPLPTQAASINDKVEQLGQISNLKVNAIRVVRRNDFLNIQAEVVNPTNSNEQLYYRFKWLDDSGFTVGGEETWKPLVINGGQKKLIETIAPQSSATDFRLELQSPNNKGVSSQSSSSSN